MEGSSVQLRVIYTEVLGSIMNNPRSMILDTMKVAIICLNWCQDDR